MGEQQMRVVTLMMSMSIDGFVAGPQGHAGALAEPDELRRWKLDRIRRAGTHIMGRTTYEEMASYWPTSSDDYAAPMNEISEVVFSKTLDEATWPGSSIARGDLAEEITSLRRQPEGEIIAWGGAGFAQSLSRARLVDQYVLITHPVVFGGGLPLFGGLPDTLRLKLLAAQVYDTGVTAHIYEPERRV
jgi:dihydrofolate reductase